MELLMPVTQAYIYGGDWVGDCPREGCANVEYLWEAIQPRGPRIRPKAFFSCSHCGEQGSIEWPPVEFQAAAMDVLMKRPIPNTRNWYPRDHDVATRFRIPHGQSIADLRAENEEHGVSF
jgi:hypothetical protein